MVHDFLEWFTDTLYGIFEMAYEIFKYIYLFIVAAFLSPLWLIPFVLRFFFARKKRTKNEGAEKDNE